MVNLELIIQLFMAVILLLSAYFFITSYLSIKGHLRRTTKFGKILWMPIFSVNIATIILVLSHTYLLKFELQYFIELISTVAILMGCLSLNSNTREIIKRALLIRLYLNTELTKYNIISIIVDGSISTADIVNEFTYQANNIGKTIPLLGPSYNSLKNNDKKDIIHLGTSSKSEFKDTVNQYSPVELQVKLNELINKNSNKHLFFIGDFLDSLIESINEEDFLKSLDNYL